MRSVHALPEYLSSSSINLKVGMLRALNRSDMCRQDSAKSAQCSGSNWNISFLQASIHRLACCMHRAGQTCTDKIQLEVRSIQGLPDYFSSSSLHPRVGMLRALNRSDMRRQDSARSAQCSGSTWKFLFFKHSFKGRHAAHTEPVRHAKTRFS